MKAVDIAGIHIEATSGSPLVLLREHDAPHRVLPIFIGGHEAASIALALTGAAPPRPLTHDLMAALVSGLDARLHAVEVTEVNDGAFTARLALIGPAGETRLDSRPSDAIALAVRVGAPLFVSEAVLDEAGSVLDDGNRGGEGDDGGTPDPLDGDGIEDAVEDFRNFLEGVDPADFADS